MSRRDGIKGVSVNIANRTDQLNLSQLGQSFTVSARRAEEAAKRKGVK